MASIIPGYEYDIFISYRQKDNKGDRWVSEFVDALKAELESTFKEDVSVYFDINPHDGLLETHDVDASLKVKLKCLIFIPIISRTYCDPKSFAWEHEFKAFLELTSKDQFGLKVRLPGGNVANRILPVQIHNIDKEDEALLEKELGGVLRAIEFIYKEPGVNKPLIPEDDDRKNLNASRYNIQINKVANAAKEIIRGISNMQMDTRQDKSGKREPSDAIAEEERKSPVKFGTKAGRIRILSGIALLGALIITVVFALRKTGKNDTLNKLRTSGERISVAVMPFRNMTNDTTLNIWQDGIQFNLITSLSNSTTLRVKQTESVNSLLKSKGVVNYASITPSIAKTISQNLDANVYIYGNINEAGGKIRLNAQLIDSKTDEAFKSFQAEGTVSDILKITDSLAAMVRNFLVISSMKKEISIEFQSGTPNSVEAYKAFILGYKAYFNYDSNSAVKLFSQAIQIDSGFIYAYFWLSVAYADQRAYDQADKWSVKVYAKKEQLPFEQKIWANWIYAKYHEKSKTEELKYAKQLLEIDDKVPLTHWAVAVPYYELHQYNNAIPEMEATLDIYKKWNTKPLNSAFYIFLISSYQETGRYSEEQDLLKKAMTDFPDDLRLIKGQIILLLTVKDTVAANRSIKEYLALSGDNDISESKTVNELANIYSSGGMPDEAEKYYREAVGLEPDNPVWLNALAYFLINTRNNLPEGLEFVEKALRIDPDNSFYLDTKGWGLFKQGKDEEALKLLERSWQLRPTYDYFLSFHLEEVKKAVANQKNLANSGAL